MKAFTRLTVATWFVLLIPLASKAQLSGSLNVQYNACDRVLTINVTGGSGNYRIAWGTSGACPVPANYSAATLTVPNCANDGTYYAFVRDLSTNAVVYVEAFVNKTLNGAFSVGVPNVFTPNGDGYNDTFVVTGQNLNPGPLNAHTIYVVIVNRWGRRIHERTFTNFTGGGFIGPVSIWSGYTDDGNRFDSGTYNWAITVTNCSGSQNYNGYVDLIY